MSIGFASKVDGLNRFKRLAAVAGQHDGVFFGGVIYDLLTRHFQEPVRQTITRVDINFERHSKLKAFVQAMGVHKSNSYRFIFKDTTVNLYVKRSQPSQMVDIEMGTWDPASQMLLHQLTEAELQKIFESKVVTMFPLEVDVEDRASMLQAYKEQGWQVEFKCFVGHVISDLSADICHRCQEGTSGLPVLHLDRTQVQPMTDIERIEVTELDDQDDAGLGPEEHAPLEASSISSVDLRTIAPGLRKVVARHVKDMLKHYPEDTLVNASCWKLVADIDALCRPTE